MKKLLVAMSFALTSTACFAAAVPCDELKDKITQKLEGKGVKGFTLDVVAKDTETTDRVVGECAGGKKKIVYKKAGGKKE